jgi:short-subunit dehydrogenase
LNFNFVFWSFPKSCGKLQSDAMSRNLENMVVVITGASSGIGRALAEYLSQHKAKLTLAARRLDRLQALNAELGGGHQVIQADVSNQDDCRNLVQSAASFHGRIDTLVCNAGYGLAKSVSETSAIELRRIFETNLYGTTDTIRAAIPVFMRQSERDGYRGQVMIVSSAVARRGLPFFGAYSATKAAQLSIAEALRVELKPSHIAVTSVHPVGTETEFFDLAGKYGNSSVPPPGKGEVRQTADVVARKMAKAIVRPRPELWPLGSARFGISIATLLPGITDKALSNYRRSVGDSASSVPTQTSTAV